MRGSRSHQESKSHAYNGNIQSKPFLTKPSQNIIPQKKEAPFFQARLRVGRPNDKYEKEAEAVADTVVKKKPGTLTEKPQAKCTSCEKKNTQRGTVQTKSETIGGAASPQLSSKIESSAGKGKSLPQQTLSEMNSSFGSDFSNIRIHDDSESVNMNKELHAQAFTHGDDIYFNSGRYNPESSKGKHLLAHELTHVVQQKADLDTEKMIRRSGDEEEQEKEHPEEKPEYPPDWQHGAPTKPVPPDPNVYPLPDPNKKPDQGPYRKSPMDEEPSTREKIAEGLREAGVPAWAVAGLVVLIIAALADPEPFTKTALLIGVAAAVLFFIFIGRKSDIPSTALMKRNEELSESEEDSESEYF